MTEPLLERLAELEAAVRRAAETIARLRDENQRLQQERKQVLTQIDAILKDLAKLDSAP
jgi:predicted nuclease with TOPRIM domain